MTKSRLSSFNLPIRNQVTCPHCWEKFPPDRIHWVSVHRALQPDPLLEEDSQQRFLPTRFAVDGRALDRKGEVCSQLACPNCHLTIPRALLELNPLFVSILGSPSSGKSYFLASMTWQLRTTLRNRFAINFADADPESNLALIDYERKLFFNDLDDELVALQKTEQVGNLYESVNYGDHQVSYPKPFVFTLKPLENHPSYAKRSILSRALCLYDNAGEHFLPGEASATDMATHHLALSQFMLFLFDPTQHGRFRSALKDKSDDPQIQGHVESYRQDLVLMEAANRIRTISGLPQDAKTRRPLVVVVTKYDAWRSLLPFSLESQYGRVVREVTEGFSALHIGKLQLVSDAVRRIMQQFAAEVVNAAEGFSDDVLYIPVSAMGRGPEVNQDTGQLGIRPKDIVPMWTEIPLLYALRQTARGLVRSGGSMAKKANSRSQKVDPKIAISQSLGEPSTHASATADPPRDATDGQPQSAAGSANAHSVGEESLD